MIEISPFWKHFREVRREIAIELYMTANRDNPPSQTPEDGELEEGGFIAQAHVLAFKMMRSDMPTLASKRRVKRWVSTSD